MVGGEAEGEMMFKDKKNLKMKNPRQRKGGGVNKVTAVAPSDRNSNRIGIKEIRGERQESITLDMLAV